MGRRGEGGHSESGWDGVDEEVRTEVTVGERREESEEEEGEEEEMRRGDKGREGMEWKGWGQWKGGT